MNYSATMIRLNKLLKASINVFSPPEVRFHLATLMSPRGMETSES